MSTQTTRRQALMSAAATMAWSLLHRPSRATERPRYNDAIDTAWQAVPQRTRYEALWPDGSLGKRLPGEKSLAWTNWPLFRVGMVQRGYVSPKRSGATLPD
jgi:hypothetical protein